MNMNYYTTGESLMNLFLLINVPIEIPPINYDGEIIQSLWDGAMHALGMENNLSSIFYF